MANRFHSIVFSLSVIDSFATGVNFVSGIIVCPPACIFFGRRDCLSTGVNFFEQRDCLPAGMVSFEWRDCLPAGVIFKNRN